MKAFGPGDDVTLVTIARSWEAGRLGAELGTVIKRIAGDATGGISWPCRPTPPPG